MVKTLDVKPWENPGDYDRCMGMFALLGATSPFGELKVKLAVPILHGALMSGNFRIYVGETGRPSAGVIWAYLDDEMTEFYLRDGYLPNTGAWNSGTDLWFLHVIAQGGLIKDLLRDTMTGDLFAGHDKAFMLRVGAGGKRRVVEFTRKSAKVARVLPSVVPTD